ncbi:MAG: site-2 protease family protein [Gammaproteobacteria bacterium]
MGQFNIIQLIIIWGPPVLFAITLHEVAHGWVANRLGDSTARMLGRLTVNPVKHIDPIGTILVPAVLYIFTGFVFGWAKPVPVAPRNFKNPRKGMAIVAVAGPLSNLLMGIFWAAVSYVVVLLNQPALQLLYYMGLAGVSVNVVLAILNIIPVPPLDGGRVLAGLLPRDAANLLDRIEPFGLFIIAILVFSHLFNFILGPPIVWLQSILLSPLAHLT